MLHYIPETLRDMAEIQRKTGNATLAQQYERQYLSLMDSIYNSQRFNVVKNQQFMYEVDKTDKEITRLHQEEEIHRQNARLYQLLFLVSILAIVLVSMLLFYVVRQKRDLEASYRKLYDINRSHVETGEKKAPRATNLLKEDQKQLLLDGIRRVMEETDEYCQPSSPSLPSPNSSTPTSATSPWSSTTTSASRSPRCSTTTVSRRPASV